MKGDAVDLESITVRDGLNALNLLRESILRLRLRGEPLLLRPCCEAFAAIEVALLTAPRRPEPPLADLRDRVEALEARNGEPVDYRLLIIEMLNALGARLAPDASAAEIVSAEWRLRKRPRKTAR